MSLTKISIPQTLYEGTDANVLQFSQNLRSLLVKLVNQSNTNVDASNSDISGKVDKTTVWGELQKTLAIHGSF